MLYRVWFIRISLVLALSILLPGVSVSAAEGKLAVTWVNGENLYIWQEGMSEPLQVASGRIARPTIAPDGEHIAYMQIEEGLSETLTVIDRTGELKLVDKSHLPSTDETAGVFGQVTWLDAATLYFNTEELNLIGRITQEDLWKADIASGEITQVLAAGEGGEFTFSQDRTHMAVVGAGRYDGEQAEVRLMDVSGSDVANVLAFDAVSTGSEYRYYPTIRWTGDGQTVWFAIPEQDLIYADSSGDTVLWQLGVDGTQTSMGTIQASFFGPPLWSEDGQQIAYLQREGESNQFDLMLADGDGNQAQVYTSGESGNLRFVEWLPESAQFLFEQGEPGDYWIGEAGQEPQQLGSSMVQLVYVSPEVYVYFQVEANKLELRYVRGSAAPALIATMDDMGARFDAVITR